MHLVGFIVRNDSYSLSNVLITMKEDAMVVNVGCVGRGEMCTGEM